jgi:hypothetical protein
MSVLCILWPDFGFRGAVTANSWRRRWLARARDPVTSAALVLRRAIVEYSAFITEHSGELTPLNRLYIAGDYKASNCTLNELLI